MRVLIIALHLRGGTTTRLGCDVLRYVAQDVIDAPPEEDQGGDADDRDQHEDQGILGQSLPFFLRLEVITITKNFSMNSLILLPSS